MVVCLVLTSVDVFETPARHAAQRKGDGTPEEEGRQQDPGPLQLQVPEVAIRHAAVREKSNPYCGY